jgi:hypothetical protein
MPPPETDGPKWLNLPRLEVIFLVLLLVTTVCSTFCAYQANHWSSIQGRKYQEATSLRTESVRAYNDANTHVLIDLSAFLAWIDAMVMNDTVRAGGIADRFTPEFKPAFAAWADLVRGQPGGTIPPGTPFLLPEYRLDSRVQGVLLEENATAAFHEALAAGGVSSSYVLNTLIYAIVLFLCGVGERWKTPQLQKVILVAALLLFSYATVMLLWLPKTF